MEFEYKYDVVIKLDGKRAAHVTVTRRKCIIESSKADVPPPPPEGFGTCRRDYVTTLFGDIEKKARKRALKIIKEYEDERRQNEKAIRFTL